MQPFASLADLEARHPAELITLAADEATGIRDDVRVDRAVEDASAEVRSILKARYSSAELASLDAESRDVLRMYAMDIALFRISLSFARGSEEIRERYKAAIKRLEAIAAGRGGLSFEGGAGGGTGTDPAGPSTGSPNQVLIDVPERMFTRGRTGGL